MSRVLVDYLGYAAAALTTTAYLPQALKVWKTRRTEDISTGMYLLMVAGVAGWLAYGIAIQSRPVIAANGFTLVLAAFILFVKLKVEP